MSSSDHNSRVAPRIRHATPADADAVARIFAGPRAIWGTLQLPYPTAEKWRKRLEDGPGTGIYSLVACDTDEPIGIIGLHTHPNEPRIRHVAQLGMAIRDDHQGRGAGTALVQAALDLADQWLAVSRIELDVFIDNEPALRLYRKFGFEVEGTRRKAALREGRLQDVFLMARLHESPIAT
ncbi:MAG: GNAT family N-acetyltransferase [Verrucomicrobiales bacterium]|nr:GNAT family N-acetyltransferase [Verrucomicrobiales bacterium]